MKKLILTALVTLAAATASADIPPSPRVEPGPVMEMSSDKVEGMDIVLLAKASDLQKFQASGNMITSATEQNLRPGLTRFVLVRRQCSTGGITGGTCLGGSQLTINVKQVRKGSMMQTTATSSVVMLRGM